MYITLLPEIIYGENFTREMNLKKRSIKMKEESKTTKPKQKNKNYGVLYEA